uniref:Guanylate kinase-like domain-containing protein n=1 Tax=Phaeomonas parva TaxID=124430 RepID=A0A7S1XVF7_9STRA|mmetsp:Transcript_434/g.1118  ORF Transcript_434/g.1118 Transcript_434/m.1118 type:complete len:285 (+) Transcript_434:219-1073(+)
MGEPDPNGTRARTTDNYLQYLAERKNEARAANAEYLQAHPEVHQELSDFMAAVIAAKPQDVFAFAQDHFTSRCLPGATKRRVVVIVAAHEAWQRAVSDGIAADLGDHLDVCAQDTCKEPLTEHDLEVGLRPRKREEMIAKFDAGVYACFSNVHGHLYGAPHGEIRQALNGGRISVVLTDADGAARIKAMKRYLPYFIFVGPTEPGKVEQYMHLTSEGELDEVIVARHVREAERALHYAGKDGNFDVVMQVDDPPSAWPAVAERLHEVFPELPAVAAEETAAAEA